MIGSGKQTRRVSAPRITVLAKTCQNVGSSMNMRT